MLLKGKETACIILFKNAKLDKTFVEQKFFNLYNKRTVAQ